MRPAAEVWVRPDEAAAALQTTVAAVRTMASQHQWDRRKQGRNVWYRLQDVLGKREGRRVA